jgi:hypothetical protein
MAERSRVHIVRWVSFERLENGVRFDAETGDGDPAQIEVTLPGPAIARLRMAPGRLHPQRRSGGPDPRDTPSQATHDA